MDIDSVRKLCLSLPHATEQVQWENDLVFKVGGKMFAVLPLESARRHVSFRCSEEEFAELIERPGIVPAPYLARVYWVLAELEDGLTDDELQRLLRQAHELVFARLPKKVQLKLTQEIATEPRRLQQKGEKSRRRVRRLKS